MAFNNRALIFQELKRYEEAVSDFSSAIEIEETTLYHRNKGECYFLMGLFREALSELNMADTFNQSEEIKDMWIYRYRARVKKALGDIEGAVQDLNTYFSTNDTNQIRRKRDLDDLMNDNW